MTVCKLTEKSTEIHVTVPIREQVDVSLALVSFATACSTDPPV